MRRRALVLALAAAAAGLPAAAAKEFGPGDLLACNGRRCVPVEKAAAVKALERLIYTGPQPARALPVAMGVPFFQLRFPNRYVLGIVATGKLDRFLSYGVVLERFRGGVWYRVPERASAELLRLTAGMHPLRVTPAALRRSR